ncbi:hypothetical protein BBFGKLBO_00655 [Synechococcus sp. CBW1107]|nr:hypothetical protein BBFGKLBO_00655 [Synechococcus sp. CBW1107]
MSLQQVLEDFEPGLIDPQQHFHNRIQALAMRASRDER